MPLEPSTRCDLRVVNRHKLRLLQSGTLAELRWLDHGFSLRFARESPGANSPSRRAPEFNLGFTPNAQRGEVERNRRRFVGALDADAIAATVHQIHSAVVWEVSRKNAGARLDSATGSPGAALLEYRPAGSTTPRKRGSQEHAGDALITSEPGILLTIRTADCLPVLIADRRRRAVAAIHAGWRGALARVIEKTVGEMRRAFGCRPADLIAVFGPAIGRCCYEVGDEVLDAFRGQFRESDTFFHKPVSEAEPLRSELRYKLLFHTQAPPGHRREPHGLHLDLAAVARAQLTGAGIAPAAIHDSGFCTSCDPQLFFSHRRDGARAGRMMAAIGIRSGP
jgi:polyphenol oxidase